MSFDYKKFRNSLPIAKNISAKQAKNCVNYVYGQCIEHIDSARIFTCNKIRQNCEWFKVERDNIK